MFEKQKQIRELSSLAYETGDYSGLLYFIKENYKSCIATYNNGDRSFVIITKNKGRVDIDNVPHLAKYSLPNIYLLEMVGKRAVVSIIKSKNGTIFADDVLESLKLSRDGGVFHPSLAGNHIRLTEESTVFMRLKYNIGQLDRLP